MDTKLEKSIMNNPTFILFLATAVVVGSTATLKGALTMSISVLLVLVLSSLLLTLLNKVITDDIRFISTVIIVAGTASLVQMLMNAFLPAGYKMVSLYLAVLAVDLSVFANCKDIKNDSTAVALKKSFKTGLYYAAVILVLAVFREAFGMGSIYGHALPWLSENTIAVLSTAPGGYMLLAFAMAICNKGEQPAEKLATVLTDECTCKCACEKEGE